MSLPAEYFPVVNGSATSDDGESFFYKVDAKTVRSQRVRGETAYE